MLAEIEPLIGDVDDDRVVGESLGIEPVKEPLDVVIDRCDAPKVVLAIPLLLPADEIPAGQVRFLELLISGKERLVPR